ncbi:hypothetical protein [Microbacterium sp. SZ1]|uniref:hypothetical protein n=1 Tax=Microbacterium sp. SZ1 TaxID=1849736 RepID=UPI00117D340B|nr:hypothetical protein [Microbacterium sp. SZ1]
MSQSYGEGAPASGADSSESSGVVQTAKDEAIGLTGTASEQAAGVVETAKAEAGAVAHEAKDQVKDLYRQTRDELRDQAAVQQRRVADGLQSVGGELKTMADGAQGGVAADLVRQVSTRVQGVAGWIGDRDPGSLLSEVTSYARRKPGTFIAVAAAAGLVVGRLTRALSESAAESSSGSGSSGQNGSDASGPAAAGAGVAAPASTAAVGTTGSVPPPVPPVPVGEPTGLPGSPGSAGYDTDVTPPLEGSDTPLYDRTGAAHDAPGEERP